MSEASAQEKQQAFRQRLLRSFTDLFWVHGPFHSRLLTRTLPLYTTDGLYVTAWPWVGALAPPSALFLGLCFGWLQWGFEWVYTESLLFLTLALIIGISSANLGSWFLLGFVFGHFFLATDWNTTPSFSHRGLFNNLFLYRVPLLLLYGLLSVVLMQIPIMTKQLLVQIPPPRSWSPQARVRMSMIGHALLTICFVYFWVETMPVLIRPVFTWVSRPPSVDAIQVLQASQPWLCFVAAVTSVGRVYLQSLTAYHAPHREAVDRMERRIEARFLQGRPVLPFMSRLSPWTRTAGTTGFFALLLSGLYEHWLDAVILFGMLLAIQAARERLIKVPLGRWPEWIERIPLLYRLIAGFLVFWFLTRNVLDHYVTATSFRPVVVLTGLAFVIMFLLHPGRTPEHEQTEEPSP